MCCFIRSVTYRFALLRCVRGFIVFTGSGHIITLHHATMAFTAYNGAISHLLHCYTATIGGNWGQYGIHNGWELTRVTVVRKYNTALIHVNNGNNIT